MTNFPARTIAAAALAAFVCASAVFAQDKPADKPPDRWQDTAELAYISTQGNSEGQTLGFKNKTWRIWEKSSLEFNAGGIWAQSTAFTYSATGTTSNFNVDRKSSTDTSAEAYLANGRYDRKVTEHFFWFAGAGWDRNRFAGIDNRYTGAGGVGNIWKDTDRVKFRTDYALSYTKEDDVVTDPNFNDTYMGARFSWAYAQKIGSNTLYTNDFVADDNLGETADWRLSMINAVSVSMSKRLALKVSLRDLYDHRPSLVEVALTPGPGTVLTELEKHDSIFSASLVINM